MIEQFERRRCDRCGRIVDLLEGEDIGDHGWITVDLAPVAPSPNPDIPGLSSHLDLCATCCVSLSAWYNQRNPT